MQLQSYFNDFLKEIEPHETRKAQQREAQKQLRDYLAKDESFRQHHVNTFLQGSFARNTAIHPGKDVDIVVVTRFTPDSTSPGAASSQLQSCLAKRYANPIPQDRSFKVSDNGVDMDVVLATSADFASNKVLTDSFAAADSLDKVAPWESQLLLIPDRTMNKWIPTNPKAQLAWTSKLNAECGGYFVPLVKMFKWWRTHSYSTPKYPKGYVLERLAGECVDKSKRDHAEGFVALLENIGRQFRQLGQVGRVPHLADPGVPANNVAKRVSPEDFQALMEKVAQAASFARLALHEPDAAKSARLWGQVFVTKFPSPPDVPASQQSRASFPPVPVRPNKPAGFA